MSRTYEFYFQKGTDGNKKFLEAIAPVVKCANKIKDKSVTMRIKEHQHIYFASDIDNNGRVWEMYIDYDRDDVDIWETIRIEGNSLAKVNDYEYENGRRMPRIDLYKQLINWWRDNICIVDYPF